MDAWDSFCQTGRISDYLQYKQQQDRNKTVNSAESAAEIREQMLYGDVPGTGRGRAKRRRPRKIY